MRETLSDHRYIRPADGRSPLDAEGSRQGATRGGSYCVGLDPRVGNDPSTSKRSRSGFTGDDANQRRVHAPDPHTA